MSELDISDIVDNESSVDTESSEVVVEEVPEEEPAEEPEESEEDEEDVEEEAEEGEEEEEEEEDEEEEEEEDEEEEEEEEEEEAPTEEAPTEGAVAPVEQVVSDIRDILSEEPVASASEAGAEVGATHDNLCSLKTLVDVLGKWSGDEIKRRNVEGLLKEGSEVDENLDDLEKVVEILQLWIKEGGSKFRNHNHFKNLDEYTLVGESRNLSEEKKVEVLKTLTTLTVNVSHKKVTDKEIQNVMNNLY